VPVFAVIALIAAFYYRQYRIRHQTEDRIAFNNPTYDIPNMAETNFDEINQNIDTKQSNE
jgi:hypothetical protein